METETAVADGSAQVRPKKPEFLMVLPNPWISIQTDGQTYAEPDGFVVHDPKIHREPQARVGCAIAHFENLGPMKAPSQDGVARFMQRTHIRYESEPLRVHNTPWYQKLVACGDLIAADVESAAQCGILAEDFVDPAILLAQIRSAKITDMLLHNPGMPMPSDPLTDVLEASPTPAGDESNNVLPAPPSSNQRDQRVADTESGS